MNPLRLTNTPAWLRTALAVAVAQVPYWLVRNPSEVVKTRQQAGRPGYSEEGVAGVCGGVPASAARADDDGNDDNKRTTTIQTTAATNHN